MPFIYNFETSTHCKEDLLNCGMDNQPVPGCRTASTSKTDYLVPSYRGAYLGVTFVSKSDPTTP